MKRTRTTGPDTRKYLRRVFNCIYMYLDWIHVNIVVLSGLVPEKSDNQGSNVTEIKYTDIMKLMWKQDKNFEEEGVLSKELLKMVEKLKRLLQGPPVPLSSDVQKLNILIQM